MARSGYWNHNVHYQPVILSAVPPGCRTALDVGCGDGLLAGRLGARCAKVTAIDRNPPMIARARAQYPSGITFHRGRLPGLPPGNRQLRLRLRQHLAAPHGLHRRADHHGPAAPPRRPPRRHRPRLGQVPRRYGRHRHFRYPEKIAVIPRKWDAWGERGQRDAHPEARRTMGHSRTTAPAGTGAPPN